MKFIAATTRKNLIGKPDYDFIYKQTNGEPVKFDTFELALKKAKDLCDEECFHMYAPRAYKLDQKGHIIYE